MICEIVGVRRVDIADGDRPWHGYSCYVLSETEGVAGKAAEKISIADARLPAGKIPAPGGLIEFEYNNRGKIGVIKDLTPPAAAF